MTPTLPSPADAPTCACGHTRDHPLVEAEPVQGTLGFLLGVMLGMSGIRPRTIRFRCSHCGQVIEESTDPEVLERHR
jgi:hypothetical protein